MPRKRLRFEPLEDRRLLFNPSDFIVADFGAEQIRICAQFVSVENCTRLDDFAGITHVDFQTDGDLVAVASEAPTPSLRLYDKANQQKTSFASDQLQSISDIEAAQGRLFLANGRPGGIVELDSSGNTVGNFGDAAYGGVAAVGNQLWAGLTQIDRFDLSTGQSLGSFTLPQDLTPIQVLRDNPAAGSVIAIGGNQVVEIDTISHEVRRTLEVPASGVSLLDVTPAADGHIMATGFGTASFVFQWNGVGELVRVGTVPAPSLPFGITWTGTSTADLSVDLSVDKTNPEVGELVKVTVHVLNSGPNVATNVVVQAGLPDALFPVGSSQPTQGTYDVATGTWRVGTLDASAELIVTARVLAEAAGRELEVETEATAADQLDPDSPHGNGVLDEDDMEQIVITVPIDERLDWGDALGTGFPTRRAQDGARHNPEGATLGARRDVEDDGQPTSSADGDDGNTDQEDDEDGLVSANISTLCGGLVLDVQGVGEQPYFLNVWMDLNANSSWGEASDHVVVDQRIDRNGKQVIEFALPPGAPTVLLDTRFRLSTLQELGVGGPAPDGEVEDHLVKIQNAPQVVYVDDGFSGVEPGEDPDGDGPATALGFDAFSTIQRGVNCVATGGTVNVAAGDYDESVSVVKTVKVLGEGEQTVVTAESNDGFVVAADSVEIGNLKITGSRRGVSAGGAADLRLSDLPATENSEDGLYGENLEGTLTISGGRFSGNQQQGLDLTDIDGLRLVDGVEIKENSIGVFALRAASIFVSGSTVSENDDDGMRLQSISGDVTLTQSTLGANDRDGDSSGDGLFATAEARAGGASIGGKLVVDNVNFPGAGQQQQGLFVSSILGKVEIDALTATGHNGNGLQINRFPSARLAGSMFENNEMGIVMTGDGLAELLITDTMSRKNRLANLKTSSTGNLQVTGGTYSQAGVGNGSTGVGMDLANSVSVEINGVQANSNNSDQLRISSVQDVTIEESSFQSGFRHGVRIDKASGQVTLTNLVTRDNSSGNLHVANSDIVTVNGGRFDNGTHGLRVNARQVAIEGVSAESNIIGMDIDAEESIEIKDSTASAGTSGIKLSAPDIFLQNVSSNDNESSPGLDASPGLTGRVRISGGSFNNNGKEGIRLFGGTADLNGVVANGNKTDGLSLSPFRLDVKIADGKFNENGGRGIVAQQLGSVDLSGTETNSNGVHGVEIKFADDVTFDGGSANQNGSDGVNLFSVDDVTFTGFRADTNTRGHGVYILHADDISVTGGSISGNATQVKGEKAHGLGVTSAGDVTTRNVSGLDNDPAVFVRDADSYSDFNSDFSNNTDGGVTLEEIRGHVTLSGTTLDNNDTNNDGLGAGVRLSEVGGRVRLENVTSRRNVEGVFVDGPLQIGITGSRLTDNSVGLKNRAGRVVTDASQIVDNTQQDVLNESGGTVEPAASVAGSVYRDLDGDGRREAGEAGLPGIPVTLRDEDTGRAIQIIATATDGSYKFDLLSAGVYVIEETQPVIFEDGRETPGRDQQGRPVPGSVSNDRFDRLELASGIRAAGFDFAEGPRLDALLEAVDDLSVQSLGPDLLALAGRRSTPRLSIPAHRRTGAAGRIGRVVAGLSGRPDAPSA